MASTQAATTKRPIWLLSMDSEEFYSAPTTTGTLKAYYLANGDNAEASDIQLIHFPEGADIQLWQQQWLVNELPHAQAALERGEQPIVGLSVYTWNAAEFIELAAFLRQHCPALLIIAGGPHVQQAEDFIGVDQIDIIIIGEGEQTFNELLNKTERHYWPEIAGLAFQQSGGSVIRTAERERFKNLSLLPSALDIIELNDAEGKPLYSSICYETSRGCPFKCSFCEWGTGAIGTKMLQFPLERIKADFRHIVDCGIENIWLADSNFGALKDDVAKTELICELKRETGLPRTFATSWSKAHNKKVQDIVLMLNANGLLPHYQLALQTLTPLALKLSNRKNMGVNKYGPIAKQMAKDGVPIASELIWGLPGDNLPEFERNLDTLLGIFPSVNIFGYTLLPGTEFYDRRDEYQLQTVPIAGYGKAKGEYVIGCHTYSREEGLEGYFLISAHIILLQGYLLPLTSRYLCLQGEVPVSPMLRALLAALLEQFADRLPGIDRANQLTVYENRNQVYVLLVENLAETYALIRATINSWLTEHQASASLVNAANRCIELDEAFAPRSGESSELDYAFDFDVIDIRRQLQGMDLPANDDFIGSGRSLRVRHPGGVGSLLSDPSGGNWMKGEVIGLY